ncbi:MAG: hypothetical protein VB108_01805 [Anaerolineaceae bacterium]|nr:hypothetical protein [Anaerolineaceae bacterium]
MMQSNDELGHFKTIRLIVVIALLMLLGVNFYFSIGSIKGVTMVMVDSGTPSILKFSGYSSFIWIPLYLGLITYALIQVQPNTNHLYFLDTVGFYFILACIIMICTFFAFLRLRYVVTFLLILCITFFVYKAYRNLHENSSQLNVLQKWVLLSAFGFSLGWSCIEFTSIFDYILSSNNWSGMDYQNELWASFLLIGLVIFLFIFVKIYKNPSFTLGVVWGLGSIASASRYSWISKFAWACAAISLLATFVICIKDCQFIKDIRDRKNL